MNIPKYAILIKYGKTDYSRIIRALQQYETEKLRYGVAIYSPITGKVQLTKEYTSGTSVIDYLLTFCKDGRNGLTDRVIIISREQYSDTDGLSFAKQPILPDSSIITSLDCKFPVFFIAGDAHKPNGDVFSCRQRDMILAASFFKEKYLSNIKTGNYKNAFEALIDFSSDNVGPFHKTFIYGIFPAKEAVYGYSASINGQMLSYDSKTEIYYIPNEYTELVEQKKSEEQPKSESIGNTMMSVIKGNKHKNRKDQLEKYAEKIREINEETDFSKFIKAPIVTPPPVQMTIPLDEGIKDVFKAGRIIEMFYSDASGINTFSMFYEIQSIWEQSRELSVKSCFEDGIATFIKFNDLVMKDYELHELIMS